MNGMELGQQKAEKAARVTRWVCEKIVQNVAQTMIWQIL
jgi:hypothetical protein